MQETGEYSKCARYVFDWNTLDDYGTFIDSNKTELQLETCKDGWNYNSTEPESTIVVNVSKTLRINELLSMLITTIITV